MQSFLSRDIFHILKIKIQTDLLNFYARSRMKLHLQQQYF